MASNEISIEKFVLILRTHAKLVSSIFIAALTVAGIITYLMPKMYTATVSLNFEFSANPVDSRGSYAYAEDSYITTQVGIIQSQHVAQQVEHSLTDYERERVIAALDAEHSVIDDVSNLIKAPIMFLLADSGNQLDDAGADSGGSSSGGETLQVSSAYNWLTRSIGYNLVVTPVFNSRIVEISYSSTDPKIAALLANKFGDAYIATNLQMIIDPARKSKVWFDEQLKSLRKNLEDAQSELTAYQQREGIVSSDERLDTEASRLQELSGQLVAAQQATRNAVTEHNKLREVIDSGASLMTYQPVSANSVVQKIKADIRDLEAQIVQNSNSLGANHPKMKKLNSELYAARERLKKEVKDVTDGINNAAQLYKEREHDLESALEAQKMLVLNLKNEHDKITVLQREVESAQATYNAALNQLNSTSMQSMVDQTNVAIIDRADIPGGASSPRVMKNMALGALAGLLLGVGLAVFLEIFTRRVHSSDDFTTELGIPLLGHLKKVDIARR